MNPGNIYIVGPDEAVCQAVYTGMEKEIMTLQQAGKPKYDYYALQEKTEITQFGNISCRGFSLQVRHKYSPRVKILNIIRVPAEEIGQLNCSGADGDSQLLFCFDSKYIREGLLPEQAAGKPDSPVFHWTFVNLLLRSGTVPARHIVYTAEKDIDEKTRKLLLYSLSGAGFLDGRQAAFWLNEREKDLYTYHLFLDLPTLFLSDSSFSLKPLNTMFNLSKLFRTEPKRDELNLLLIGPPSCGKTALIYFLYTFALRTFLNTTDSNYSPGIVEEESDMVKKNNMIVLEELSDFMTDIIKVTKTSKDFRGTEPQNIKMVWSDAGGMRLRIYNISGEIFSNLTEHETVFGQLVAHLENVDPNKTFVLLCDEYTASPIPESKILFDLILSKMIKGTKAHKIFVNIMRDINLLRIVTKFDAVYRPKKPARSNLQSNVPEYNFEIVHEPLDLLNHHPDINFAMRHFEAYRTSPDQKELTFTGSKGRVFRKNFICTGLFDRTNFSGNIYEKDGATGKEVLGESFRGEKLGNLDMYGIAEIFATILKGSRVWDNPLIKEYKFGSRKEHKISLADYNKIRGL